MREITRSVLAAAREALRIGEAGLPRYSHPFSRHDYTQPQLFALLVVRQVLGVDYRTLCVRVAEWGELRRVLRLRQVPHYSTLCYAAQRLEKRGSASPSSSRASAGRARSAGSARASSSPSTARGSPRTTSASTSPTARAAGPGSSRGAAGRSSPSARTSPRTSS